MATTEVVAKTKLNMAFVAIADHSLMFKVNNSIGNAKAILVFEITVCIGVTEPEISPVLPSINPAM